MDPSLARLTLGLDAEAHPGFEEVMEAASDRLHRELTDFFTRPYLIKLGRSKIKRLADLDQAIKTLLNGTSLGGEESEIPDVAFCFEGQSLGKLVPEFQRYEATFKLKLSQTESPATAAGLIQIFETSFITYARRFIELAIPGGEADWIVKLTESPEPLELLSAALSGKPSAIIDKEVARLKRMLNF